MSNTIAILKDSKGFIKTQVIPARIPYMRISSCPPFIREGFKAKSEVEVIVTTFMFEEEYDCGPYHIIEYRETV